MSKIVVYNKMKEEHTGKNVFLIHRPYPLGNPYTHIKERKTKADIVVKSRDEAIRLYKLYFDEMYPSNKRFKDAFDEIYETYASGEYDTIYLGCYCAPEPCHGDFIKEKILQKHMKEKIRKLMVNKNNT